MKLTPQVARELNKKGAKISSSQIVRSRVEEKIVSPPQDVKEFIKTEPVLQQPSADHHKNISVMLSIMDANEVNMQGILNVNKTMAEVLLEMAKPKPKKKFTSIVGRGTDGRINQIDTVEQ